MVQGLRLRVLFQGFIPAGWLAPMYDPGLA
jgi:hypothetical protein